MTLNEHIIIWLYTTKLATYSVMAAGAAVRLYENHVAHYRMRGALMALTAFFACLTGTMAFRVAARLSVDPAARDALLRGWPFIIFEAGATVCAMWLFIALQRPRGDA